MIFHSPGKLVKNSHHYLSTFPKFFEAFSSEVFQNGQKFPQSRKIRVVHHKFNIYVMSEQA